MNRIAACLALAVATACSAPVGDAQVDSSAATAPAAASRNAADIERYRARYGNDNVIVVPATTAVLDGDRVFAVAEAGNPFQKVLVFETGAYRLSPHGRIANVANLIVDFGGSSIQGRIDIADRITNLSLINGRLSSGTPPDDTLVFIQAGHRRAIRDGDTVENTIDGLLLEDLTFDLSGNAFAAGQSVQAIWAWTGDGYSIRNLSIRKCSFTGGTAVAGATLRALALNWHNTAFALGYSTGFLDGVSVIGNSFDDMQADELSAVAIGHARTDIGNVFRVQIRDNSFRDLRARLILNAINVQAQGVDVYGNRLERVMATASAPDLADINGIYSKSIGARIHGNRLRNSGGQAAIMLKGVSPGGEHEAPSFSRDVYVYDNDIEVDDSMQTLLQQKFDLDTLIAVVMRENAVIFDNELSNRKFAATGATRVRCGIAIANDDLNHVRDVKIQGNTVAGTRYGVGRLLASQAREPEHVTICDDNRFSSSAPDFEPIARWYMARGRKGYEVNKKGCAGVVVPDKPVEDQPASE